MFIMIILLAILGLVGTDIFVPSLPSIAQHFHLSMNVAQFTLSFFLASFSLSQLIYGPASDRYGRKPILLVGIFIFIIGSITCVFSHSFHLLCLGRII